MLVIGITGLIASGKSTLTDYLSKNGYCIFSADEEVKKLYKKKSFILKLKKKFPKFFLNDILDKKKELEHFIHPIIKKKCNSFIEKNKNKKVIFLDVPLLFESGWDKMCNKIILVKIDKNIQKERYLKRGGGEFLFEKILKSQKKIDFNEKIKKSDFIIDNSGNLDFFYKQIKEIENKILNI